MRRFFVCFTAVMFLAPAGNVSAGRGKKRRKPARQQTRTSSSSTDRKTAETRPVGQLGKVIKSGTAPQKYKRWSRDPAKDRQRDFALGHSLRWLAKTPSDIHALHFPGGQAAETTTLLDAGLSGNQIFGLERDPDIAKQIREAVGSTGVEVVELDAASFTQAIASHIFDYVSLDYAGPYNSDALGVIDALATRQKNDRWVLHIAHLGKRDPLLPILKLQERKAHLRALNANRRLGEQAFHHEVFGRGSWNETLSREQRAMALLNVARLGLFSRLMVHRTEAQGVRLLRRLVAFDNPGVPAMLRAAELDPGRVPPRKRWRAIERRLVDLAKKNKMHLQNLAFLVAKSVATGLLHGSMGSASQGSDVDYLLLAMTTDDFSEHQTADFAFTDAKTYAYTSDSGAPMVGFVAVAERLSSEFMDALSSLNDAFRVGGRPKIAKQDTLIDIFDQLEKVDPGVFKQSNPEFTDLGGKAKPRLNRKRAIDAFKEGATTDELFEKFNVSNKLRPSLPALRAHVTMGTYEGPKEKTRPLRQRQQKQQIHPASRRRQQRHPVNQRAKTKIQTLAVVWFEVKQ